MYFNSCELANKVCNCLFGDGTGLAGAIGKKEISDDFYCGLYMELSQMKNGHVKDVIFKLCEKIDELSPLVPKDEPGLYKPDENLPENPAFILLFTDSFHSYVSENPLTNISVTCFTTQEAAYKAMCDDVRTHCITDDFQVAEDVEVLEDTAKVYISGNQYYWRIVRTGD